MVITAFAFVTACINSIAILPARTEGTEFMNFCCFGSSGVLNLRGVGI